MGMETGTDTKTVSFDLEILEQDPGSRCYLCHASFGQMFAVRPPHSSHGRMACIAHVGYVADQWDEAEQR